MSVNYLGQREDDATSVRSHITWRDEHILHPHRSHKNLRPKMLQVESFSKEQYEKQGFKNRPLCQFFRRHLRRTKITLQRRTEKPRMALGHRVEKSKNSLKKTAKTSKTSLKKPAKMSKTLLRTRIRTSKNTMSQLGKGIQKRFVKTVTKFRQLCGRKRDDNEMDGEGPCPCARYVKVSRTHSLAATNDSTIDLQKQLKSTGHLSKNWQEPDSRPTSVDVRELNHFFSTRRSSSRTIYQCVSYPNGNEYIEPLTSTAVCKYGDGIDEIHFQPAQRKGIRGFFRRWCCEKRTRFSA